MIIILSVVCCRQNCKLRMCWEQNQLSWCALHKITLSECAVHKFPLFKNSSLTANFCLLIYETHLIACLNIRELRCTPSSSTRTLLENRPKVLAKGTGCKSSWYLWPAAIKGKVFGTRLKHHPVPKLQYRNRLVPPTGTKSTWRNRYRLVEPTGA